VTSVVIAFIAGIFCNVAFKERDRNAALMAVAVSGGFLVIAASLVGRP
jgi:hypothetical protein